MSIQGIWYVEVVVVEVGFWLRVAICLLCNVFIDSSVCQNVKRRRCRVVNRYCASVKFLKSNDQPTVMQNPGQGPAVLINGDAKNNCVQVY
jgi:hypothetical protein